MANGSQTLTTYYAKRIIGDSAANTAATALLQTGENITTTPIWILSRTNRATDYGIKYTYDSTNGDKIEFVGGASGSNGTKAWVKLDTGDVSFSGILTATNTTDCTAKNTGAVQISGGLYVAKQLRVNDKLTIYTQFNRASISDITANAEHYIQFISKDSRIFGAFGVYKFYAASGDNIPSNSNRAYMRVYNSNSTSTGKSFNITAPPDNATNTNAFISWTDSRVGNSIFPYVNNSYTLGSSDLRWSNGYFTTSLLIGSTSYTSTTSNAAGTTIGVGQIDLSASTPAINFHFNNSTSAYTSRIIESASGYLKIESDVGIGDSTTGHNLEVYGTTTTTDSITVAYNGSHIFLKNTQWTKGTTPESQTWSALEFLSNDSTHARVALLEATLDTSGNSRLNIYLVPNVANSDAWNGIVLQKTNENVLSVGINGTNTSYTFYVNGTSGFANDIYMTITGKGLYLVDSASKTYAGIYDNGSNLWIGATSSTGQHHKGGTYISAGHDGTNGNKSIYISIPTNGNASTTHTSYALVYKDATGSATQGIYTDANGKTAAMTYSLSATVNASGNASRIAYYSGKNAISGGTVTTDGAYFANISYLTVNTDSQTSYRFYVNGTSYFNGNTTVNGQIYGTWLRIVNNSSNNTDDAMVYFENKNSNDWAMKINCTGYDYGLQITCKTDSTNALAITGRQVIDGKIYITQPAERRDNGIVGSYDSTKAAAIWSMGASYQIAANGSGLGTLYGAAYAYQDRAYIGSQRLAGGHQFVWAQNGTPYVALGDHVWSTLSPSSWIDGQRYNNAAYNIKDYSNTGSYNPWMRATNTWSSGEESAKVGRWFSFGTLGTSFYWIGSTTSRTTNSYDYGMTYNISNGTLTATTFSGALSGNASTATKLQTARSLWGNSFDGSADISGRITLTSDTWQINFRNNDSYRTGFSYQTYGNEALLLAMRQSVTSFIVANGVDPNSASNSQWTGVTPALQCKSGSVRIGGLWGHNTSPDYKLRVDGNIYTTGITYFGDSTNSYHAKAESKVTNTNGTIGIYSSTNRGLYEYTDGKWIIYLQHSDDTVRFGYNAYCYSSSVCSGNSATATALTSNAGSGTQPIYFSGGKPTATSYALNATVNAASVKSTFAYYSSTTGISSYPRIRNIGSARYPIDIYLYNDAGNAVGEMWYDAGDATNFTLGRWNFLAYSPKSTAATVSTGKYEYFYLPDPTKDRTSNASYAIRTSKDNNYTVSNATTAASCTGNAATATNVAWSGVTNKPTLPTISSNRIGNGGSKNTTVNISGDCPTNADYGFLVIANSWVVQPANYSVYVVTGLQRGTGYGQATEIVRGYYGPTVSFNNTNGYITFTFFDGNGGGYSILKLY